MEIQDGGQNGRRFALQMIFKYNFWLQHPIMLQLMLFESKSNYLQLDIKFDGV
jgi:hypothetical protein